MKPYKGGNDAFYRLHQLDIDDKHKMIIPVGSALRCLTFDIAKDMMRSFPDLVGKLPPAPISLRPADRQFPLQDGATVLRTSINGPPNDETRIIIEIAFGKGQILEGEPIDPTLSQICEFVESVFDVFESKLPGFVS